MHSCVISFEYSDGDSGLVFPLIYACIPVCLCLQHMHTHPSIYAHAYTRVLIPIYIHIYTYMHTLISHTYTYIHTHSFVNSHEESLNRIEKITSVRPHFSNVDLCDSEAMSVYFSQAPTFDACIHFAGLKVCVYACINVCVCAYISILAYTHTCAHMYIHIHSHSYMYMHIHTCMYILMHTYMYICIHTPVQAVGESVQKPLLYYSNNLIGTLNLFNSLGKCVCMCMYVCMYVSMCLCVYVCILMRSLTYVCIFATCTHIYACTCTYIQRATDAHTLSSPPLQLCTAWQKSVPSQKLRLSAPRIPMVPPS